MGHKEDLLEGAKRCLHEKGYAHTTARDIVQASGTNLASIGYHYGSKESLLNAAMVAAVEDWTDRVVPAPGVQPGGDTIDAFEQIWTRVIGSFDEVREMLVANFEGFTQAERVPELRDELAEANERARRGLASLLLGVEEEDVSEEQVRTLGSLLLALMPGVMAQYLISPEQSPTGAQLAAGLRLLARGAE